MVDCSRGHARSPAVAQAAGVCPRMVPSSSASPDQREKRSVAFEQDPDTVVSSRNSDGVRRFLYLRILSATHALKASGAA
jgi:hypothetical protein